MKGYRLNYQSAGSIPDDTLGKRLHACRIHMGLERKEFCERVGLKPEQLRRLELGKQSTTRGEEPRIANIAKICGVTQAWLYAGSNAPRGVWPEWWNVAARNPA